MENHHSTCLICGSQNYGKLSAEFEHAHLVQCQECDFVFGSRIPSPKEITAHYAGYVRNNELSPITVKRYEELLEQFEPYRNSNRILDVGCGDGHFLAVAKSKGWNVFGTEYTDEAVKAGLAKGITMFQGRIQDYNQTLTFDVITSFEVIEHINDGNEHVAKINSLLRSGGLFYFTTPNFDSLSRRILGGKWKIIEYPEHLCYYTASTIHLLVKQNGFQRLDILTTGCALQRFRSTTAEGKAGIVRSEDLRETIEAKPILQFVKRIVNLLLNWFRLGDTLKGYYVKH